MVCGDIHICCWQARSLQKLPNITVTWTSWVWWVPLIMISVEQTWPSVPTPPSIASLRLLTPSPPLRRGQRHDVIDRIGSFPVMKRLHTRPFLLSLRYFNWIHYEGLKMSRMEENIIVLTRAVTILSFHFNIIAKRIWFLCMKSFLMMSLPGRWCRRLYFSNRDIRKDFLKETNRYWWHRKPEK